MSLFWTFVWFFLTLLKDVLKLDKSKEDIAFGIVSTCIILLALLLKLLYVYSKFGFRPFIVQLLKSVFGGFSDVISGYLSERGKWVYCNQSCIYPIPYRQNWFLYLNNENDSKVGDINFLKSIENKICFRWVKTKGYIRCDTSDNRHNHFFLILVGILNESYDMDKNIRDLEAIMISNSVIGDEIIFQFKILCKGEESSFSIDLSASEIRSSKFSLLNFEGAGSVRRNNSVGINTRTYSEDKKNEINLRINSVLNGKEPDEISVLNMNMLFKFVLDFRRNVPFRLTQAEIIVKPIEGKVQIRSSFNSLTGPRIENLGLNYGDIIKLLNLLSFWEFYPESGILDKKAKRPALGEKKVVNHCFTVQEIIQKLKDGFDYYIDHLEIGDELHMYSEGNDKQIVNNSNQGLLFNERCEEEPKLSNGLVLSAIDERYYWDIKGAQIRDKFGTMLGDFLLNYTFDFFGEVNIKALSHILNKGNCWNYKSISSNWKSKRYLTDISYILEQSGLPRLTNLDKSINPTSKIIKMRDFIPKSTSIISKVFFPSPKPENEPVIEGISKKEEKKRRVKNKFKNGNETTKYMLHKEGLKNFNKGITKIINKSRMSGGNERDLNKDILNLKIKREISIGFKMNYKKALEEGVLKTSTQDVVRVKSVFNGVVPKPYGLREWADKSSVTKTKTANEKILNYKMNVLGKRDIKEVKEIVTKIEKERERGKIVLKKPIEETSLKLANYYSILEKYIEDVEKTPDNGKDLDMGGIGLSREEVHKVIDKPFMKMDKRIGYGKFKRVLISFFDHRVKIGKMVHIFEEEKTPSNTVIGISSDLIIKRIKDDCFTENGNGGASISKLFKRIRKPVKNIYEGLSINAAKRLKQKIEKNAIKLSIRAKKEKEREKELKFSGSGGSKKTAGKRVFESLGPDVDLKVVKKAKPNGKYDFFGTLRLNLMYKIWEEQMLERRRKAFESVRYRYKDGSSK